MFNRIVVSVLFFKSCTYFITFACSYFCGLSKNICDFVSLMSLSLTMFCLYISLATVNKKKSCVTLSSNSIANSTNNGMYDLSAINYLLTYMNLSTNK